MSDSLHHVSGDLVARVQERRQSDYCVTAADIKRQRQHHQVSCDHGFKKDPKLDDFITRLNGYEQGAVAFSDLVIANNYASC